MDIKSFGALTGVASGFIMGNEFNSLSKISIMCGTKFQEYAPFQDSPEDLADELIGIAKNISGNILGGITLFASVLGDVKSLMQTICVVSSGAAQAMSGEYDIADLIKVVAWGASVVEDVTAWLKKFIPQNISNETVLGTLEVEARIEAKVNQTLSLIPFPSSITIVFPSMIRTLPPSSYSMLFTIPLPETPAETIESHKEHNKNILTNNGIYTDGEYIENQRAWKDVKFGNSDMSYSGCEIMATYNALKALGEDVSADTVVDLIATYENNGAVLGGKWGTSPYAIENYFREEGYEVEATTSLDTKIINGIGERNDTVIVNAYNDENDITAMIHTVSITKDEAGTYSVHNAYYTNTEGKYVVKDGYSTLQEAIDAISKENPKSIDVIGISKR